MYTKYGITRVIQFCSKIIVANFFQPEDEFEDSCSDDFEDDHVYDSPSEQPSRPTPMNEDRSWYQQPKSPQLEMSNYDTPHGTINTHHTATEKTTSMEFTVGTHFESGASAPLLSTPTYNNPLVSSPTVDDLSTTYDAPGTTGN